MKEQEGSAPDASEGNPPVHNHTIFARNLSHSRAQFFPRHFRSPRGEITLVNGRVRQSNFHDFPMLRIHEVPEIEVHIVPSTEKQGGIGEPGVPCAAPAVANAIFAAVGKRIRRLPIQAEDLRSA